MRRKGFLETMRSAERCKQRCTYCHPHSQNSQKSFGARIVNGGGNRPIIRVLRCRLGFAKAMICGGLYMVRHMKYHTLTQTMIFIADTQKGEKMDDLISRRDVIDLWNEYQYTIAVDAIKYDSKLRSLLSAQPEQRWIPCSERLPEREEQVLIYAMNVHFVLAKYKELRTLDGEYIKDWVIEDAYNPPSLIKHKVIAWMPLTDPYQAERREEEYGCRNNS